MGTSVGASAAAEGGPFDHGLFDRLLRSHVTKDGVDYAAFSRGADLGRYLEQLERAQPSSWPEAERLAFWINVYNAHTVHAVAVHRPSKSIRDLVLPGRDGQPGTVWKAPLVRVGGRSFTLDEVEHDLIRKTFRDPRVHFALVCAAYSCPPLRAEAYSGAQLDRQLDDQAHRFLHGQAKGCRVDAANGVVYVSEIFAWYKEDFGDDAAVGRYIARYLPETLERRVLESGRFRLVGIPFDWSLNDASARRSPSP
jgi:hypothetical protein